MRDAYPFESDEARALTFLPLAMRRSLDLVGLHVSLEAWGALPMHERRALLEAPVDDAASRATLRRRIEAALVAVGHTARSIEAVDPLTPPWRKPESAAAIVAAAAKLGHHLDAAALEALDDVARFALAHLAAKPGRSEALAAALRHFACTSS